MTLFAVNGVCLTASFIGNGVFTADVYFELESIKMTTFTNLKVQPAIFINLERAMLANGDSVGHIMVFWSRRWDRPHY